MDCYFDVAKVFANNGIDSEALQVGYSANYLCRSDLAWIPIYDKAFDTCVAYMKKHENKNTEFDGNNCDPKAFTMVECIHYEAVLHCPVNFWNISQRLNIRELTKRLQCFYYS